MICSCNCPITLSDYNFADQLEPNTAVYAPITLEEIVIVMIIIAMGASVTMLKHSYAVEVISSS